MKRIVLSILLILAFDGCLQILAIKTMADILDYGFESLNEESDLEIAKEALGSNLKLIESLIKGDPTNEKLLLYATQGYTAYALAFVEDDSIERARVLYLRAKEYGVRILIQNSTFKTAVDKDIETFRAAVASLSKSDIPALFWTGFGWGSYINITRTDPAALIDLAKVEAMMEFVRQKDSSYYYGGAHLFFGTIEGTMPAVLGGKPEKAKDHFERCLAINGGKFLLTYVFYAKTYAVQVQDRQLFDSLLTKVEETSINILPDARLPNAVAKEKAKLMRSKIDELF